MFHFSKYAFNTRLNTFINFMNTFHVNYDIKITISDLFKCKCNSYLYNNLFFEYSIKI